MPAHSTRVTSLQVEALIQASERPKPATLPIGFDGLPINPLNLHADWSITVDLTTSWRTDVTRADTSNHEERRALYTRPLRKLRVQILGMDQQESFALLQTALAHMVRSPVPVPLYCDQMLVDSASTTSGKTTILGDTTFKRFFAGGRVAIMQNDAIRSQSGGSVQWGIIEEVGLGYLKLTSALSRLPTSGDLIFPCIDVELTEEAAGLAVVDTIYRLELEWSEVSGNETLPGIWPAVVPGDPSVVEPIVGFLGGRPVFDFDPDWSRGLDISPVREIDRINLGKGSVQQPKGWPEHIFEYRLMAENRERAWQLLRFFDAMRGRYGEFYTVHPLRPFKLTSPGFASTTSIFIEPAGSHEEILYHYGKVACFRANGTAEIRQLLDVQDNTTSYRLVLDPNEALPGSLTDYVEVQPIFLSRFDSDSVTEKWATDSVAPSIPFRIRELANPETVTASNESEIPYKPTVEIFTDIPNMNMFMMAGTNCFGPYGRPIYAWPSGTDEVAYWYDVRNLPGTNFINRLAREGTNPVYMTRIANFGGSPHIIKFSEAWQNNSEPAVREPAFSLAGQLSPETSTEMLHLWSNAVGWTLIFNLTPYGQHSSAFEDRYLVDIRDSSGNVVFRWYLFWAGTGPPTHPHQWGVRIRRTTGATVDYSSTLQPLTGRTYPSTWIFRYSAISGRIDILIDGETVLAVSHANGIATPNSYSVSDWASGLCYLQPPASWPSISEIDGNYATRGYLNCILSYKRALTYTELNTIGPEMAALYNGSWTNVPSNLPP